MLAKPDTGKATQVAETQMEEQLQAMIDSLTEKINKASKFDQRGGGGGGGGGSKKPQMPSEAELRLLKRNQEAINVQTPKLDAQPEKDKEALMNLGNRQGEIRNLLDQLIQKATQGQAKLGPEPDPKDQLPEEASKEDVDNQEVQDDLLHDRVNGKTVDKGIKGAGDRMGRVRQRLALNNDPGKVTQEIQKRIVVDLDELIKMAQKTEGKPKPGSGKPGDKMGPPKPAPGQGQQPMAQGKQPGQPSKGGQSPAQNSTLTQGGAPNVDPNADVTEKRAGWGGITPREREAVQESAGEQVIGKYRQLVDDYYRSLSEKTAK